MERDRANIEAEEKAKADQMKKIKDQFADPNSQWEKDKVDIQNEAVKEKKSAEAAAAADAAEAVGKPQGQAA